MISEMKLNLLTGSDVSVVVPGKENKRMIKKFLHQKDSWILGEIHRLKEQSSDEVSMTFHYYTSYMHILQ